jgi:hypothetical protein
MSAGIATDRATAVHEAGHCLVAWLFDWPIEHVTVERRPGQLGHVRLGCEIPTDPDDLDAVLRACVFRFAGAAAVEEITGQPETHDTTDLGRARDDAEWLFNGWPEYKGNRWAERKLLKHARDLAFHLVREHAEAIGRLADELQDLGRLTGDAVIGIIRRLEPVAEDT